MFGRLQALIVGIVAGSIIIIIILILLIRRRFVSNRNVVVAEHHQQTITQPKTSSSQTELTSKRRPSYQLFGRGSSTNPFLDWADHPSLITDAVEGGWSRFVFTKYAPSPSVRSSLFSSLRVSGDYHNYYNNENNSTQIVEESWEIGPNSVDFMQKLHFKIKGSNLKYDNPSTVRMALPLPGPPVPDSFPQEAYFEITVLDWRQDSGKLRGSGEGEKTKLLFKQSNSSGNNNKNGEEGLFHVSSSRGYHLFEELKIVGGGRTSVKMTIGMSIGGFVTTRVPGTYPGSIGFNSDGSVFLGGMKLVFESEKEDWAKIGKVIGCGFEPKKKKVYFTVDSELVHVIHCKSEDFGTPLYPVIATNLDITVLVNLGQSSFSYMPANAHRTPNPCFIGPVISSSAAALGYEDSKELFSMGRIDAEWLGLAHSTTVQSTVSNSSDLYSNFRSSKMTDNEEGEAEFFEIVLDSQGR